MSHPRYPNLFSPLDFGGLALPNRVIVPAMVTRLSGEDGFVNQDIKDRYVRFAKGEPGLIVVEATAVHQSKSGPLLRLGSDEYIPGHRELVQAVHDTGAAKIALQIIHFLKISRSGWRQTVDMLSREDIQSIIANFGAAAARAREAGYDTTELHMAHAYTLASFLSGRNTRRDEYGGQSLESRMRLMSEVILEVRRQVGPDYPISVRMNGEEFIKDGYSLTDSRYIALRMAQLGVAYISVSAGGKFEDAIHKEGELVYPYTGYSGDRTMPSRKYPQAVNVYLAEGIKRFINQQGYHNPIVTSGRINTPELAEEILAGGRADLIGLARPMLADADWPKKARDGHEDKIVHCVYGNVCKQLDETHNKVRCGTLWPREFLHAPEAPDDHDPPQWPNGGQLEAKLRPNGQLRLTWEAAVDPQGMYGYEIFRSVNGGAYTHLTSSRTTSDIDEHVLAGNRYAYYVRPFDLAGNRGEDSNIFEVEIDPDFEVPADREIAIDPEVSA